MKGNLFLKLLPILIIFISTITSAKDYIQRGFPEVYNSEIEGVIVTEGKNDKACTEPWFYYWPGWWYFDEYPDNCWGIGNNPSTGNYAITFMSYCMWWPGFSREWGNLGGLTPIGWKYPVEFSGCSYHGPDVVYDANLFWGNHNYISDLIWDMDIGHSGDNCSMVATDNPYDTLVFKSAGDPTLRAQLEYYTYVSDNYGNPDSIMEVKCTCLHWYYSTTDDWFACEAEFENTGTATIDNFYIGVYIDPDLIDYEELNIHTSDFNVAYYYNRLQTAYIFNPEHEEYGVVGVQFLSEPPSSVILSVSKGETEQFSDSYMYNLVSGNTIEPDQTSPTDRRIIIAVGPGTLEPGATYYFAYAFIMGENLEHFKENAEWAWWTFNGEPPPDDGEPMVEKEPEDLYRLIVYPNPASEYVIFYNLPVNSYIVIRTVDGSFVTRLYALSNHKVIWELDNFFKKKVANGVYLANIRCGGHSKIIKIVVKR